MAFVVPFLPYIAAGIGALASVSQGNAQKSSLAVNARIKEQQADTIRAQTVGREELQRSNVRALIGDQLAVGAESGLELSGSRADILRQTMYAAELDSLNIRYDGAIAASGLDAQAGFDMTAGEQAQNAGYLNAASSLMSGASGYINRGSTIPYSYNNDAGGGNYSSTGAQIRMRR